MDSSNSGGHSIAIARLAQKLHAAGWVVPVRALLSDCNTARKVANCPRALNQTTHAITALVKSDEICAESDEAAAEVLSIGYFTTLQVLFAIVLYSPVLVAFLNVFAEVGTFLTTASLWTFIIDGFFLYLLALVMPFASLLWVMIIKFFVGGDIYKNGVIPGVYPKWSKMHLQSLVHRAAGEHGAPAAALDVSQRAAHGVRVAAARCDRGPQPSVRA